MKQLPLLTAYLLTIFVSQAQTDSTDVWKPKKASMATIHTYDDIAIKGWLYEVNDSQVVLVNSPKNLSNPSLNREECRVIPLKNISEASMRKKNKILKSALLGLGIGAVTGVIIGFADGDDVASSNTWNIFSFTAEEKALAGGLVLGTGGAIIGTIIGAVAEKKFIIGGKKEKNRDLAAELSRKLMIQ
jgi:hypothetical protein